MKRALLAITSLFSLATWATPASAESAAPLVSTAAPFLGAPVSTAAPRFLAASRQVRDPASGMGPGDGVYGRFNGDLAYRLGLGVEWDLQAHVARPLIAAEIIGYQTLGLSATFRQGVSSSDHAENILSLGMSLSPFFLWRWSKAMQTGYPYWDLFIDSITIIPGIALGTPRSGTFASTPGFEIGLLGGLPILPRANGPWLRTRFNVFSGREALGYDSNWGASFFFYLEWQGFIQAGLLKTDYK